MSHVEEDPTTADSSSPKLSEGMTRFLLIFGSLLFAFLFAEFFLWVTGYARSDKKITMFEANKSFAHCYTSDPKALFPINVKKNPSQLDIFKKKFYMSAGDLNFISTHAPHCVEYDIPRRERGENPKRSEEVMLVGDSFTFGEGVTDTHTLAAYLNKKFPSYNFRNYGRSGTNVSDIFKMTMHLLLSGKAKRAKHIFYFYNLNDVLLTEAMDKAQSNIVNDFQNIRFMNINKRYTNNEAGLLSYSRLLKLIRKVMILRQETSQTTQNYLDMYLSKKNKLGLQQTFDQIQQQRKAVEKQGKSLTLLIYPLLFKQKGKYPFQPAHDRILAFCRKAKLRCIDLSSAFDKHNDLRPLTVHPIDFHPNGKANKMVIDYLARSNKLSFLRPEKK